MGNSTYFTSLDCHSGYWSISIAERDREKTAFCTPQGHFEFKRMPFGLMNAPAIFQNFMNVIMAGKIGVHCFCYLDDIIVFSKNFEQHLIDVENTINTIYEFGLRLKPEKCSFFQTSLEYLGHIITCEGIKPNPNKIEAVLNFMKPHDITSTKSFLGLINYYRKFIKNISELSLPLNRLTKKSIRWQWNDEAEYAFQTLKHILTSDSVLIYPDFSKQFFLCTDASNYCIGAILEQEVNDEGDRRPIMYLSRTLSGNEKNWTTTEKELLALIWALGQCKGLIYGQKLFVVTDHEPLKWILNKKDLSQRLMRWALQLQDYNLTIITKPGKRHQNADALSRLNKDITTERDTVAPELNCNFVDTVEEAYQSLEEEKIRKDQLVKIKNLVNILTTKDLGLATIQEPDNCITTRTYTITETWREVTKAQQQCAWTKEIVDYLKLPIDQQELTPMPKAMHKRKFYLDDSDMLFTVDELRNRARQTRFDQVVIVDKALQLKLLFRSHDSLLAGHFSDEKTYERLRADFYWPRMRTDVKEYCETCLSCQQSKNPPNKKYSIGRFNPVSRPFQRVSLDIKGPFPRSSAGNTFVLVMTDHFTRFPITVAIPNKKSETVAQAFCEHLVGCFGYPESVLTDYMGIKKLTTTAYHAACNGMVERINRTLGDILTHYVNKVQNNWDKFLPFVTFAMRTACHSSVRESPFFLTYGREPNLNFGLLFGDRETKYDIDSNYCSFIIAAMRHAFLTVREFHEKSINRNIAYREKTAKDPNYVEGQLVLLYTSKVDEKGTTKKLTKLCRGPYRIIEKKGDLNYIIKNTTKPDDIQTVHAERLKKYMSREPFRHVLPDAEIEINDETETDSETEAESDTRRFRKFSEKYDEASTSEEEETPRKENEQYSSEESRLVFKRKSYENRDPSSSEEEYVVTNTKPIYQFRNPEPTIDTTKPYNSRSSAKETLYLQNLPKPPTYIPKPKLKHQKRKKRIPFVRPNSPDSMASDTSLEKINKTLEILKNQKSQFKKSDSDDEKELEREEIREEIDKEIDQIEKEHSGEYRLERDKEVIKELIPKEKWYKASCYCNEQIKKFFKGNSHERYARVPTLKYMNSLIYQLITENEDVLSIINGSLVSEYSDVDSKIRTIHQKKEQKDRDEAFEKTLLTVETKLSTSFDRTKPEQTKEISEKATELVMDMIKQKEYRKRLINELKKDSEITPIYKLIPSVQAESKIPEPVNQIQMSKSPAIGQSILSDISNQLRDSNQASGVSPTQTIRPSSPPIFVKPNNPSIKQTYIKQLPTPDNIKMVLDKDYFANELKRKGQDEILIETDQTDSSIGEESDSQFETDIEEKQTKKSKYIDDQNLTLDKIQMLPIDIQEGPEVEIGPSPKIRSEIQIPIDESLLGAKPKTKLLKPGRPPKKSKKALKAHTNKVFSELAKINKPKNKNAIEKDPRDNRPPPGVSPYALRRSNIKPIEVPHVLARAKDATRAEHLSENIIENEPSNDDNSKSSDEPLETTIMEACKKSKN